jgi:hypothetical protein
MSAYSAEVVIESDSTSPEMPVNVKGFSYEKHYDVTWTANKESDLSGYRVYRWNGSTYSLFTIISKDKNYMSIYIGNIGAVDSFKVSAYDNSGNESEKSPSVFVSTRNNSDEEFLDMVQRATFRFFWNHAHPVSGLTRERYGSGNTVAAGGSGFGLMALIVGIERGFITREEGTERMLKILDFLYTKTDRFHGAYSHWFNGETGDVIPFSQYDNGGDLVETAYLMQGILTIRNYFNSADSQEVQIRYLATQIWESVEWSWYRRSQYSTFLYWHWSPNYAWQINMKLVGWNETMITYLLGIASPTFGIPASMYYSGWASASNYSNGNTFYGYKLNVGLNYGGPLFFAHYSFLGFDPRFLKDNFTNYFQNNRNTTLIHRAYCTVNPYAHPGYDSLSWGLTASDDPFGYSAHAPYQNDNGTITPSAGISSIAYTPLESMELLKNLYRTFGYKVWGEYGFKDAFNVKQNWFADSYISIDQGPIIIMIENYRSQLLWDNFMANPEIQTMIDSIGFRLDTLTNTADQIDQPDEFILNGNYPNPFNPATIIDFIIPHRSNVKIEIYDLLGRKINTLFDGMLEAGEHKMEWNSLNDFGEHLSSGIYLFRIYHNNKSVNGKMVLLK